MILLNSYKRLLISLLSYICFHFRNKGCDCASLKTFGIVTGMINAGLGLGSMLGPVLGGVLVESIGYVWLATAVSASIIIMVSPVFV